MCPQPVFAPDRISYSGKVAIVLGNAVPPVPTNDAVLFSIGLSEQPPCEVAYHLPVDSPDAIETSALLAPFIFPNASEFDIYPHGEVSAHLARLLRSIGNHKYRVVNAASSEARRCRPQSPGCRRQEARLPA